MFDWLLDIQRVRQYMNWPVRAGMIWRAVRSDARFLARVRAGLLPLPTDHPAGYIDPFPAPRPWDSTVLRGLQGLRVAVVCSGGSGATASSVGVARALEEAGVQPVAYGVCSGSALFGIPLAAGMTADEVARATLSLRPGDYLDPDWRGLLTAPLNLMRGWSGLVRGDKLEEVFDRMLGGITLGELPTPVWTPVWNIEENYLQYVGSTTHPGLSAARAIRMAVALPLAVQPNPLDGGTWMDGGIIDIFPVRPLIDDDVCDVAILVNGFYPPGLVGDSEADWRESTFSIVHVANQTRTMQHLELARRSLAELRAAVPHVIDLSPVPYEKVHGAGLYGQFLDNREWGDFMCEGYWAARRAFEGFGARPRGRPARRP
jgi:NTE family protein